MAEAAGGEAERPLSPRIQSYARDLLRRFSGNFRPKDPSRGASSAVAATEEDSGLIELSLGLSLGGFFGADPDSKRDLVRSSSVASLPFLQRAERDPAAVPVITRTCSLPVEIEEEQRKRRELQCLRRMEAKRKRSEKRNSHRWGSRDGPAGAAAASAEEGYAGGEDMQQEGNGDSGKAEAEHPRASPGGPNGVLAAAWAPRAAAPRAVEGMRSLAPASHGSAGSQGGSFSGVSDYSFDAHPLSRQGSGVAAGIVNGTEPRSQSTVMGEPTSYGRNTEAEDASKKKGEGGRNGMMHMMEEMPCVSTRGGGPNGRRVEGFLYRYRKGEEVRIVCVCHGSFFSPAEFVKHAGGGEVAHPLRHIVVNPSPSSFL